MSVITLSGLCLTGGALTYVALQPKTEPSDLSLTSAIKEGRVMHWVSQHQSSVKAWLGFLSALLIVLGVLSDGDFSFVLTLSSMIGLMSFLMVLYKIEKTQSVKGVSGKMMACYICVLFSRLISIVFWEGYLPWDSTGDWLYQLCEGLSLVLCSLTLYNIFYRFKGTYNADADTLNPLYIIPPCFILACVFHPDLNKSFIGDMSWSFALYLEAFAGLPQLVLFHKEKIVEPFTSHFLAAQCLSKICSFVFWFKTANELNSSKAAHGYWVIVIQAVQLIIMADFIYQYIRCVSKGISVNFIVTDKV